MAKKKATPLVDEAAVLPQDAPPDSLRLEWRSPAELAENPRNWRRHPEAQTAALADVIGEVGWAGACLFNEATGRLIDGHARRKVALEQGCERVPVLVGSWSEADEAKILATLDPIGALATRGDAALRALLADVQTQSGAVGALLSTLATDAARLLSPAEAADDPKDEWQGMPGFEQEDNRAYRSVVVHLEDEQAVQDFMTRIGQQFSAEAKYLYHPKREKPADRMHYVDEP